MRPVRAVALQNYAARDLIKSTLVAVYGTLRRGLHNHACLCGAVYRGATEVEGYRMFTMNSKDSDSWGAIPYVVPTTKAESKVRVEVFDVGHVGDRMFALDSLEGHPDFYTRVLVDVPLAYIASDTLGTTTTTTTRCWMYIFRPPIVAYYRNLGMRKPVPTGDYCNPTTAVPIEVGDRYGTPTSFYYGYDEYDDEEDYDDDDEEYDDE